MTRFLWGMKFLRYALIVLLLGLLIAQVWFHWLQEALLLKIFATGVLVAVILKVLEKGCTKNGQ